MNITSTGSTIAVEMGHAKLVWDAARGGQITAFEVHDRKSARPLTDSRNPMPGLELDLGDGGVTRLADHMAEMSVTRQETDALTIETVCRTGVFTVYQTYEVFADGAVFCEFQMEIDSGKSVTLRNASLNAECTLGNPRNVRWGAFSRQPWLKKDATSVHLFAGHQGFKESEESLDAAELAPLVSLDLGWDETRCFSNRIEWLMEDWTAIEGDETQRTRTLAQREGDRWTLRHVLFQGDPITMREGAGYRNKWGLLIGASRNAAGAGIDPVRRHNALGARICHCIYPYVRVKNDWPWSSMPIRQTRFQPPMVYQGPPELERVDEAAALGADLMIIHQFWMSNPGSNNEPVADYRPEDAAWLKAFIKRCHDRDLRVLLYARATEMYNAFEPFFEEFLTPGRDGLYLDWSTPLAHGWVKCSTHHFSAYNFYQFHRALRKRVGEQGILIGHTGDHNQLSANLYDASLAGEFSVLHEVLLGDPLACSCFGVHAGCGGNLLGGGTSDRGLFISDKATAFCAALGMSSHVIMSPNQSFDKDSAYIQPLWNLQRALPGRPVRIDNPCEAPIPGIRTSSPDIYALIYYNAQGQALLIATNLGETQDGVVELDFEALGIPAPATLQPLTVPGACNGRAEGRRLLIADMAQYKLCGAMIQ